MTAAAGPAGPSQTILLVDAEILVRHALADYLRECGYVVIEAASGAEAVAVLEERSVPVDTALCDAQLADGMNGFELRRWVREHRPDIDIVLAGNLDSAARAAADLCDEGPQLARPYDPQAVVDHIRRLLAARSPG